MIVALCNLFMLQIKHHPLGNLFFFFKEKYLSIILPYCLRKREQGETGERNFETFPYESTGSKR